MANCFLCEKKVGMFDGGTYIEQQLVCNSCYEIIRNNVDCVFLTCGTEDQIIDKQNLVIKTFQKHFSGHKLSVLVNYVNHRAELYCNNIRSKKAQTEKIGENGDGYNINLFAGANSSTSSKIMNFPLTTGGDFEGYCIKKYNGLVSGECVIGSGLAADFFSSFSDLTGSKSKAFSEKMKEIKNSALNDMIEDAIARGGNGIIGISFDYITFSGMNMMGVSVYGTSVIIEKAGDNANVGSKKE